MNICSGSSRDRHDEICFEGNDCPLCKAIEDINSISEELNSANEQINDLVKGRSGT